MAPRRGGHRTCRNDPLTPAGSSAVHVWLRAADDFDHQGAHRDGLRRHDSKCVRPRVYLPRPPDGLLRCGVRRGCHRESGVLQRNLLADWAGDRSDPRAGALRFRVGAPGHRGEHHDSRCGSVCAADAGCRGDAACPALGRLLADRAVLATGGRTDGVPGDRDGPARSLSSIPARRSGCPASSRGPVGT